MQEWTYTLEDGATDFITAINAVDASRQLRELALAGAAIEKAQYNNIVLNRVDKEHHIFLADMVSA